MLLQLQLFLKELILKQAKFSYKTDCFLLSLLLLLGTWMLTGCQTAESDEAQTVAENVEPMVLETVTAVSPTNEPFAEAITDTVAIDNCLDCHTSKELLIDTADPEEEVISENEGEG
jgi:uncharacterized lipoprotein YajG